ncbi:19269_t:CDS:1, partial [Funneliformis geosporum]
STINVSIVPSKPKVLPATSLLFINGNVASMTHNAVKRFQVRKQERYKWCICHVRVENLGQDCDFTDDEIR